MDDSKRIRLVFKDDDILSEAQKSDGLNRSCVLLKLHQHGTVSDVASHLLEAFQLHQSCPYGLRLSISGFALPPFESTCLLRENEIIRIRKRRDSSVIEGNNVANALDKLKAMEQQKMHNGVLLLANEEFGKEKGGNESDSLVEESENVVEDSEDSEDSSDGNADPKDHKRKAQEELRGSKKKKQCCKAHEKNAQAEEIENSHQGGVLGIQRSVSQKEKVSNCRAEDNVESNEESSSCDKNDVAIPDVKRDIEVQENRKVNEATKAAPKETKKVPSRSARRKYAKRRWMREMANIQKKNAACESEGLRNWKEDRAKAEKNKVDGQSKGLDKWKKFRDESTVMDDQPKGLLYWKQTPQNSHRNNRKWKQPKQMGWLHEQPNQEDDIQDQRHQNNGDVCEQPAQKNDDVHEQPAENSIEAEPSKNCGASKLSSQDHDEEHEVVPIVIRPGHIRFEPLERDEENAELNHITLETIKWNGITSKKKGQKWGLANSPCTPRRDSKNLNKNYSEILNNEKGEQSVQRIEFDKLPVLPGTPKEGDLLAYRILELSSSWTPELSAFQVGKVAWYNSESNHALLVPVSEYPVASKKVDDAESLPPDNSLYNEDGSLEIDLSALVDVRIVKNGNSGARKVASNCLNDGSTNSEIASKPVLPSRSDKPTVLPSSYEGEQNQGQESQPRTQERKQGKEAGLSAAETGGLSVWEQISETIDAKKEQLSKESNWGKSPKKLQLVPRNSSVKNEKKIQPPMGHLSAGSSQDKQHSGNKSWSYKVLRGSALGPTMDILRSKNQL